MHLILSTSDLMPGNILAYHSRMVLHHHNALAARLSGSNTNTTTSNNNNNSSTTSNSGSSDRNNNNNNNSNNNNNNNNNNNTTNNSTMGHQRPIIDLLVAMIAVPTLILCALQLEKNLHDMTNSPESRWLVFALGVGMLIVSVIICGYVTHRMGVCIWTGPIDEMGNPLNSRNGRVPHINSQNDILRIVDTLPPSYESVIKFDIPPPPYDCLVIDMEQCKSGEDCTGNNITPGTIIPPSIGGSISIIPPHSADVAVMMDVRDLKDQQSPADCSCAMHI